ncbi:hypothetical protein SAMN02745163_03466 [Clostridium cavendishii DSM 21758]|uniref:Uncharacterized protein n=1 Tax=Clostridium cavendishii DSM 21758 TaxID=1121302 RepID=A0A1M6QVC5_9CLOT|nr:hypothetical protein SAMN02745163_03466 [Clostridium cavendishii DSM 21758]
MKNSYLKLSIYFLILLTIIAYLAITNINDPIFFVLLGSFICGFIVSIFCLIDGIKERKKEFKL